MTTSPSPTRTRLTPYMKWLITASDNKSVRSALRKAGTRTGDPAALRYLSPFTAGENPQPFLLHASAFATYEHVRHTSGPSLGTLARTLVTRGVMAEGTARTRISGTQPMTLSNAHRVFTGFLTLANSHVIPVDWQTIIDMYQDWDNPNRTARIQARWRIVEDFETC